MSEKIYALLLWLYPSRFREEYSEEALRLFRDRAHDEKGFVPKLRLWLDLFVDLVVSLPSQYVYLQPELAGPRVVQSGEGTPCFFVLEDDAPRPATLCSGIGASIAALAIFWSLLGRGGRVPSLGELVHNQPQGRFAASARQMSREAEQGTAAPTNPVSPTAAPKAALTLAARHRVIGAAVAQLKRSYIDSTVPI